MVHKLRKQLINFIKNKMNQNQIMQNLQTLLQNFRIYIKDVEKIVYMLQGN